MYFPEDDGAAAEAANAAQAEPTPEDSDAQLGSDQSEKRSVGNVKAAEKTPAEIEEEERARKAREADVAKWRADGNSTSRVRPGNAWERIEFPPDDAATSEEAGKDNSETQKG